MAWLLLTRDYDEAVHGDDESPPDPAGFADQLRALRVCRGSHHKITPSLHPEREALPRPNLNPGLDRHVSPKRQAVVGQVLPQGSKVSAVQRVRVGDLHRQDRDVSVTLVKPRNRLVTYLKVLVPQLDLDVIVEDSNLLVRIVGFHSEEEVVDEVRRRRELRPEPADHHILHCVLGNLGVQHKPDDQRRRS